MLNKNLLCYSLPPNHVWANGGMADTQVLGTCLARGFGSSPNSPTSEATILELIVKLVLASYKFVATHVALMTKCCIVERVCIGFKRVLGHWLVLGTTHQTHTYPLLHILQQYQRTFFKINMYALVDSFCNKCNKYINTRHLLMQHTHYCIQKLRRIEHNEYK